MSYYLGYLIVINNYGSQYQFQVLYKGKITHEGFSTTHNGAISKAKRVIKVFVG